MPGLLNPDDDSGGAIINRSAPVLRNLISTFIRLSSLLILLLAQVSLAGSPVLVYDPTLSSDELAPWLGYLGARSAYREQHKLASPASGEIIPTFDEEVTARGVAAAFYSTMNSRKDPYWVALAKVEKAGFLKQYVWVYLHQPNWSAKDRPRNLEAFKSWSAANLKNHIPQTRGKLMASR